MTTKNKPNGSYSTKHGPNGGAVPSSDAAPAPAQRISTRASHHEPGRAGSVDASVFSVADSVSQAVGADRKATADLAEPEAGKRLSGTETASMPAPLTGVPRPEAPVVPLAQVASNSGTRSGEKSAPKSSGRKRKPANPFAEVPPGREPLPVDGEAFVDAVHAQVDLVELEVTLLRCKDEKVVQRELGCLRELRYGKRAPTEDGEETTEIIFDAPRPPRDLP